LLNWALFLGSVFCHRCVYGRVPRSAVIRTSAWEGKPPGYWAAALRSYPSSFGTGFFATGGQILVERQAGLGGGDARRVVFWCLRATHRGSGMVCGGPFAWASFDFGEGHVFCIRVPGTSCCLFLSGHFPMATLARPDWLNAAAWGPGKVSFVFRLRRTSPCSSSIVIVAVPKFPGCSKTKIQSLPPPDRVLRTCNFSTPRISLPGVRGPISHRAKPVYNQRFDMGEKLGLLPCTWEGGHHGRVAGFTLNPGGGPIRRERNKRSSRPPAQRGATSSVEAFWFSHRRFISIS